MALLQAVWRDFAALESEMAVHIVSRSADAMACMLGDIMICGRENWGG